MRPRREKLSRPYPMVRVSDRELTDADAGPAFVWDIDKTYLDTRFSQLKDLAKIPLEFGIDKRAVPGAVELLRGLREGRTGREHRPVWFVSASPPQISSAIERKMLLDGVEWDGITYKDPLRVLFRGKFGHLRSQLAFKLSALLDLARDLPKGLELHLFGDDVEQDALAYCLFADVAAGRLRGPALVAALERHGIARADALPLADEASRMEAVERVAAIHIRLVRSIEGETIARFGPQVSGFATFGAAAVRLEALGLLSPGSRDRVLAAAGPGPVLTGRGPASEAFLPAPVAAAP